MDRGPWRNWYHCIASTYGTWLAGDPRGWRSRHHREHVDGDYKNPPPEGKYDEMHERSQRRLTRPPVVLSWPQCVAACKALAEALLHYNAEIVDLAVTATHFHVLVRFTSFGAPQHPATGVAGLCQAHHFKDGLDPVPRYILGKAKSWCTRAIRHQSPGTPVPGPGRLWAARAKIVPIRDRAHQLKIARYIRDHAHQRGAVWSLIRADDR